MTTCFKEYNDFLIETSSQSVTTLPLGGDYWSSTSQDITYLISHVTQKKSQRASDFMSGSSLLGVTNPPKFGDHRHCGNGHMFLICHVTSQNYFFKCCVTEFGSFGHCLSGDITFLIYQMISQDNVIKWLCNFSNKNFSQ